MSTKDILYLFIYLFNFKFLFLFISVNGLRGNIHVEYTIIPICLFIIGCLLYLFFKALKKTFFSRLAMGVLLVFGIAVECHRLRSWNTPNQFFINFFFMYVKVYALNKFIPLKKYVKK